MSTEREQADGPDAAGGGTDGAGHARETEVFESDPNADSAEGLAGGMGVSSERTGELREGGEPATYGAEETHPDVDLDTGRPEQSSDTDDGVRPDRPPRKDHTGRLHGGHNRPNEDEGKG